MFIKDTRKSLCLGAELFPLLFVLHVFNWKVFQLCVCVFVSSLQSKTKCALVVLKTNILSIFIFLLEINSFTKQCKWVCVYSWKGEIPGSPPPFLYHLSVSFSLLLIPVLI